MREMTSLSVFHYRFLISQRIFTRGFQATVYHVRRKKTCYKPCHAALAVAEVIVVSKLNQWDHATGLFTNIPSSDQVVARSLPKSMHDLEATTRIQLRLVRICDKVRYSSLR